MALLTFCFEVPIAYVGTLSTGERDGPDDLEVRDAWGVERGLGDSCNSEGAANAPVIRMKICGNKIVTSCRRLKIFREAEFVCEILKASCEDRTA